MFCMENISWNYRELFISSRNMSDLQQIINELNE
jgi:hypothetical protein